MRARKAFTLVELLVVIGIIAVLISILLPALSKARYQAVLVQCSSNIRQYCLAIYMYADEHKGWLPRYDFPHSGWNTTDLSYTWYYTMRARYKLPHDSFFCPTSSDEIRTKWYFLTNSGSIDPNCPDQYKAPMPIVPYDPALASASPPYVTYDPLLPPTTLQMARQEYFFVGGYSILIPRWDHWNAMNFMWPPDYVVMTNTPNNPINGTDVMRGPIRLGEKGISDKNPIVTDTAYALPGKVPDITTFPLNNAPQTYFSSQWGNHFWRGRFDRVNEGFIDGHVDAVRSDAVKWRYRSNNAWVCW